MDALCSFCNDRKAEFKCRRCRSPICDECAFKIDLGAFCSRKCANDFREFHRAKARANQGPRISITRLIFALIVAGTVAVLVAWWQGWLPRSWTSQLQQGVQGVQKELEEDTEHLRHSPSEPPQRPDETSN